MTFLTATEKNKVKFFVNFILYVDDDFLDTDYDSYQYARIQDAIADCEAKYALIADDSLQSDSVETIATETESSNFVLQVRTVTYSISRKLSYQQTREDFMNSVDRLISALGFVY